MRPARAGVVSVVALLVVGCGGPKAYVRPGFLERPPLRVAVLPFIITYPYDRTEAEGVPPAHQVAREVLRKTFFYGFTAYGYEDLDLAEVDATLAASWGPLEEEGWHGASPQELAKALGADALVYGELDRLIFFSTPLYTETSLDATLRMVEGSSGEVLWRQALKVAERGGALMKKGQVVDFLKDQARSFDPEVKFLRVSDVAVRRALKGLPNPPMSMDAARPAWAASGSGAGLRLAVLPFEMKQQGWQKQTGQLREQLTASLQESSFEILEINRVDAVLQELGWQEGELLPSDLSLQELAQALGANAFLRGTVTDWGRSYYVVGSWVTAGLSLELIDAQTAEVVWFETKKNRRHAGILKGPTGYKSIATAPITGLRTSNLERVALHLTREMVEALSTSPAVLAYVSEQKH
jgi:hypothetical protein